MTRTTASTIHPLPPFLSATLAPVGAVGLLALTALGCGHKGPVLPPPLMNPTATYDLKIQQRGGEMILEAKSINVNAPITAAVLSLTMENLLVVGQDLDISNGSGATSAGKAV